MTCCRGRHLERAVFRDHFCDARFDIFGDFRQRGAGVGRRKLQAVILRRIVAGCEVDGAVEFAAHDFECYRGSGGECFAQQRSNAVALQDVHSELGKFFGVEACVAAHQNRGLLRFGLHVFRDGRNREPHIGERKIVGDEATPSRGAKLNRRVAHGALF